MILQLCASFGIIKKCFDTVDARCKHEHNSTFINFKTGCAGFLTWITVDTHELLFSAVERGRVGGGNIPYKNIADFSVMRSSNYLTKETYFGLWPYVK